MKRLVNAMSRGVLFVAEKNDAAKSIAQLLSKGTCTRKEGKSKFNKIYEFTTEVFGSQRQVSTTSVSGHLMGIDFGQEYQKWENCETGTLFDAPIEQFIIENMKNIEFTLRDYSMQSDILVIWTDCDREGENIGGEIEKTCLKYNRRLDVYRARFSEITPHAIRHALNNLVRLDKNQIIAVDCRTELDLRIGAAFTRLQTLYLRKKHGDLLHQLSGEGTCVISYGSCQFPTLGFVVDRYLMIKNFIPENFWKLRVIHLKNGLSTEFSWERGRLFWKPAVEGYFNLCLEKRSTAKIINVDKHPKSKYRPVAMDTICLEKLAVRNLKMGAKQTMDIAEKLYSKGYISYPRTETNIFPQNLALQPLIEIYKDCGTFGPFANKILNNGGPNPRNGKKSDQAHPPIHPLKMETKERMNHDGMWKVYELIVRHFLACCSFDAKGQETKITMNIAEEIFHATGLQIEDRGYLEIYPYEKWSDKILPEYVINEKVSNGLTIEMPEGTTTAPPLLSESDLISLMDKFGIGTDATHAEHIETIKKRKYAMLNKENRFYPSPIGLALVESYNHLGYQLSKPNLRSDLEKGLEQICKGEKTKEEVLNTQIQSYKRIFKSVEDQIELFGEHFKTQAASTNTPLSAIENLVPSNRNTNTYSSGSIAPSSRGSSRGRGRGGGRGGGRSISNNREGPAPTNNAPRISTDVECLCKQPSVIKTCPHTIASFIFLALNNIPGNYCRKLLKKDNNIGGEDNSDDDNNKVIFTEDNDNLPKMIKILCENIYQRDDDNVKTP
uniref:DNA topoisomerase n=1 Tax=Parastrongyloides trichosuri TaxID=131310 RepID=A0A0N5A5K3_PARTI